MKNILAEYTDGGVHYSFRYAEKEDKKKIIKFYESMDSESIYFRFLSYFKDFSSHVEKIFGEKNKLGFAIIGEDESNKNMEAFFHAENGPAYRIGLRMGLRMEFDEDVYHGKAPLNEIYTIALNNLKEKNVSLYYERI